jgi:hypothetical protein
VARKVVAQAGPAQRRSGLNRAQLKALAAQQAMTEAATRRVVAPTDAAGQIDLSTVATARRRVFLTRDQEYAYIRADLVRLVVIAAILLVVLLVVLFILR